MTQVDGGCAGADTAALDTLVKLRSDAAATLSVSRVAIGSVSEAEQILSCPTAQ